MVFAKSSLFISPLYLCINFELQAHRQLFLPHPLPLPQLSACISLFLSLRISSPLPSLLSFFLVFLPLISSRTRSHSPQLSPSLSSHHTSLICEYPSILMDEKCQFQQRSFYCYRNFGIFLVHRVISQYFSTSQQMNRRTTEIIYISPENVSNKCTALDKIQSIISIEIFHIPFFSLLTLLSESLFCFAVE